MKKKKTSKILMPAIMLAITAAFLVAYLMLGTPDASGNETENNNTGDEVTIILQRDAGKITELSYTLRGSERLTFAYNSASAKWI